MDPILDAPVANPTQLQFAGFWIRAGAYMIDTIILQVVNVGLSYALYNHYDMYESNSSLTIITTVIGITYFCLMESSLRQATLGKLAVGIKVGDLLGERISFGRAFGRYLSKILSALILCIGFMMAGWDPRKQALHDRIMNTYVFYA